MKRTRIILAIVGAVILLTPWAAAQAQPGAGPSAVPYRMIHEGRTAADVARQICAVERDCTEHRVNGPGPGQTTLIHALDPTTARYVSDVPGQIWTEEQGRVAAIIRVLETTGGAHYFIEFDGGGTSFPAPWISQFDRLKPVSPQP